MNIDKLNMLITLISIVVTIISMVRACKLSKSNKQYKREILQLRSTFDLVALLNNFQVESDHFQDRTRGKDWHRGIDSTPVISPFRKVLSSFGSLYHLMENKTVIKDKVNELNVIVQTYENATSHKREKVTVLILEITNMLQEEVYKNTKKVINSKD